MALDLPPSTIKVPPEVRPRPARFESARRMTDRFTVKNISRDELKKGLADGSMVLVDVREPYEYEDGHIPGARLNALQSFDPAALPPQEAGKQIVLSCRSGKRSLVAMEQARAAGRTDIDAHYAGGMLDWNSAGEPVEE